MSDQLSAVPAGWYPDPSGAPQNRWWDGTRWNDATQPTQPTVVPHAHSVSAGYGQQLSTANPTTPYIWVLALLPILSVLDTLAYTALGGYDDIASPTYSDQFTAADGINVVFSLIAFAAYVGFGVLDHRELKRRGLPRPFPWGWAFIPIVYVIGRSVVVYQRTRKGLAPLFVWIGLVLLDGLVSIIIVVALGWSTFSDLSTL